MAVSPLTDAQRERVDALFDAALDVPVGERMAWAVEHAADDDAVRESLLALLRADLLSAGVLDRRPAVAMSSLRSGDVHADPLIGTLLGVWRLVAQIGRGGMGTVYRAERADAQFTQTAAVKILPHDAVTATIVRRFVAERQILASLEHPFIARILDGGVSDDGRPYFAMEFVDGEPIDVYCERRELSLDARLDLFADVCRVIAFAHSRLVIHRDLKPSNVLVAADGTVKLVDFGIAKLLRPSDGVESDALHTTGTHALTPGYASPEQLAGERVTTATDVYGLGLILWELMAGRALHRIMQPQASTRPSTILAALLSASIPLPSEYAPPARQRALRGDLDSIAMRALAREANDRYSSVEGLLDDLSRYRQRLPVKARKTGVARRAALFVRRNTRLVTAAALLVAVVIAYAVTMMRQTRRVERALVAAEQARNSAERTTQFMVSLFESTGPGALRGESLSARQLLDRGQSRVDALSSEPLAQASLMDVLGRVYLSIGEYPRAETLLVRALTQRRAALGDGHPDVVVGQAQLATVLRSQARDSAAAVVLTQALAQAERTATGIPIVVRAGLMNQLARLRFNDGDGAAAERLADAALALRQPGPAGDTSRARSYEIKAMALDSRREQAGSEAMLREALVLRRAALPALHPEVLRSMGHLARSAAVQGRAADAARAYAELIPLQMRVLGDSHPFVAVMRNNMSTALMSLHEYGDALRQRRRALDIERAKLGPSHQTTLNTMMVIGEFEYESGDPAAAVSSLRAVLPQAASLASPDADGDASARATYVMALTDLGRLREAAAALVPLRAMLGDVSDTDVRADSGATAVRAHVLRAEARLRYVSGDRGAGVALLTRAVRIFADVYGAADSRVTAHQFLLATWLAETGNRSAAAALHRRILRVRRSVLPATSIPVRQSERAVASLQLGPERS